MKSFVRVALVFVVLFLSLQCSGSRQAVVPGKLIDGRVLLPNGWMLSPAGKQVEVGDTPLNFDISPDERYIIVTNNGFSEQGISIVDVATWTVVQTVPIAKSWLGIKFIDDGKRFLVSGGNDNQIKVYDFQNGRAVLADSIVFGPAWPKEKIWIAGFDLNQSTGKLFVAARQSDSLFVVDLPTKQIVKASALPAKPYTVLLSRNRKQVYVSLWGGSSVAIVDATTYELVTTIAVGDHPNDMVESPDGKRLFVANGNNNTVSVIDLQQGKVTETISSALTPNAPNGSTPNSVALDASGKRLYIANADNNYLAVIDVSDNNESRSLGFIPVGWYPTCVRVLSSTNRVVIANGKGGMSKPNPRGPNPERASNVPQYIARLLKGSLSLIDEPTEKQFPVYTTRVYENSLFKKSPTNIPHREPNPIPQAVGEASPIKHVFYIIKENRTYDQVFGDIKEGNGDSTICIFPESVTPNHHALVRQFVLLDNFYADAEVSADGHNWSMGAYATDYVEKSWPTNYSTRGGNYDFESGGIASPSLGYIWDFCKRAGVSYRSYGEFVENGKTDQDPVVPSVPALAGHAAPWYRGWDMNYSDIDRVTAWAKEFDEYETNGGLPQFQVLRLPNDHTEGTRRGKLTPKAFVAQNDLALGVIIERISKSRFWNESAIFVVEDDAQNGSDHVDAHRTVALVISPYTKRGFVDSEMYATSSMLRTMELILGLPPMSQFDAAATPMHQSFTLRPDFSPFEHRSVTTDLNQKNVAGAYGQQRSEEMNFATEDATPEIELNEIIWKSIRGERSVMPAPVRSAFVKAVKERD
jgi:YVTN family beta-propeller protein